jgi:hypothetical protein
MNILTKNGNPLQENKMKARNPSSFFSLLLKKTLYSKTKIYNYKAAPVKS